MRYAASEIPIPGAFLADGEHGDVTVEVWDQVSSSLLPLTDNKAYKTALIQHGSRRLWQWSCANLNIPISGFAQLVVSFTHIDGKSHGEAKVVARGVYDKIEKTYSLTSVVSKI